MAAFVFLNHSDSKTLADKNKSSEEAGSQEVGTTSAAKESSKYYKNPLTKADLIEKLEAKEEALVFFYHPNCTFCQKAAPIVMPLAEKMNISMKQYNLMEFSDGYDDYEITGTPTIVYFKDGKESDRLIGYYEDKEEYIKWFKQHQ